MARIVVNPADEDEVIVVGAGGVEPSPEGGRDEASPAKGDYGESSSAEVGRKGSSSAVVLEEGAGAGGSSEGMPASAPGPTGAAASREVAGDARDARRPKAAPSAGYRETTLEDLESSRMPFAQKVVIIAAVVCIIGAIVYYFVAMR